MQIANRLMALTAESDSNRNYAGQLKQQLESELNRAVEERNKHEHLHSLYKLLTEERDDWLKGQLQQSQEISELRNANTLMILQTRRMEEELDTVRKELAQEIDAKTQMMNSMCKA